MGFKMNSFMKIPNRMYKFCKGTKSPLNKKFVYFEVTRPIPKFYFMYGYFDKYFEELSLRLKMIDEFADYLYYKSSLMEIDEIDYLVADKANNLLTPDEATFFNWGIDQRNSEMDLHR